ncbi:hypothetical protein HAQ01_04695 [Acidithiobacillus thiooxidans]|nr:hypothetical protein [Acidithiobacillus thiooxidans]
MAAVLSLGIGIGTADAGLFHDMEDVGKGLVVDAAVHEGEKVAEHEVEKKAAENAAGKIYSRHTIDGRTAYKSTQADPSLMDEDGLSNIQRMQKGRPPIDESGKPFNIHHVMQEEPGPVTEIKAKTHQLYHKILHGLKGNGESFRNNKTLGSDFKKFKNSYWKLRAKDYTGGK